MKNRLVRRYGSGHLHFITCCCYRRLPFFGAQRARDLFLKILSEVRDRYDFALLGYVVMPEHIHLLISEPSIGTPTTVMQVLKQRVSRALRRRRRRRVIPGQMNLWEDTPLARHRSFWQRRFYDFNVWSARKKNEKLNYMHFNPVRRSWWQRRRIGSGAATVSMRLRKRICARRTWNGREIREFNLGKAWPLRGQEIHVVTRDDGRAGANTQSSRRVGSKLRCSGHDCHARSPRRAMRHPRFVVLAISGIMVSCVPCSFD